MNFKKWLTISEMASFTVPPQLDFDIPCDRWKQQDGCKVRGIDMRFEDPPQVLDKNGKPMNQGSKFVAKLPNEDTYIVYHGMMGLDDKKFSQPEAEALAAGEYTMLPKDWWVRAEPLGVDWEPIRVAQGELARQKALSQNRV